MDPGPVVVVFVLIKVRLLKVIGIGSDRYPAVVFWAGFLLLTTPVLKNCSTAAGTACNLGESKIQNAAPVKEIFASRMLLFVGFLMVKGMIQE